MKLSKFWVSGYGTFAKRTEFDLDYKGITTIFGLNRDAGASYTNASGKSLLFTSIPEIAYGTPPSGKDQTKHSKAEIGVEFVHGQDVVAFTKSYVKGKKSFQVTKNGKDVNVRTLDYTQQKLQGYFGGSEEDFYTTRYIDNTIPHPLIVGKAATRQDFFVRMFNLENVDATRHLLLAELREVQKSTSTYKEVKALFDDLKCKSLPPAVIEEKQLQMDALQDKQTTLLKKINKYQVIRDLVRFESQNSELIAKFNVVTSLKTFDSDLKALKARRKLLKADRETAQDWEMYTRLNRTYLKEFTPLKESIESLVGQGYDANVVKEQAAKHDRLSAKYESLHSEYSSIELSKPEELLEVDTDKDTATAKVYALREELRLATTLKDGVCPTCGAPHKQRKSSKIKEELQEAKATLAAIDAYQDYERCLKLYKEQKQRKDEITPKLNSYLAKIYSLKDERKAKDFIDKLPNKPSKPEGDKLDLDEVNAKLDKLSAKVMQFDQFSSILEQLSELSSLTKEQRENVKGLDTVTDDLAKINVKLNNLTAEVTSGREANSQLKALATRGKVLKRQSEDEPILKALIEAYSKKGLKKMLIQQYATLLQQQVNKFTRLFFAEDIRFEFSYTSKLDVLAHRKVGKKVSTIDVRRLSGAERRMLTLVLVVATISLLPKNKRSNFLILDEPEANMGPEAVQTFVKALPILNKVVPHIVVITPRPELEIEGSRVFTVVKRNGVSTLTKGKVGQQ